MEADVLASYRDLEARGIPVRHTHMQGDSQWAYNDEVGSLAGRGMTTEPWRSKMYLATGRNKRAHPETYRDLWTDLDSVAEAKESFSTIRAAGGGLLKRNILASP